MVMGTRTIRIIRIADEAVSAIRPSKPVSPAETPLVSAIRPSKPVSPAETPLVSAIRPSKRVSPAETPLVSAIRPSKPVSPAETPLVSAAGCSKGSSPPARSRRNRSVEVPQVGRADEGPLHLCIDPSGLKRVSDGEWQAHKHRTSNKRRSWRNRLISSYGRYADRELSGSLRRWTSVPYAVLSVHKSTCGFAACRDRHQAVLHPRLRLRSQDNELTAESLQ